MIRLRYADGFVQIVMPGDMPEAVPFGVLAFMNLVCTNEREYARIFDQLPRHGELVGIEKC